ncbi:hypothetical protein UFOVP815_43 [uncultured Caudovirales phage]|uniref:Tip attachment protein J n=1 Tax=uncultured Caudovirales phage TaxID=2100421 RepID=A0A6J5PCX1_9CAUD|nr:hypothetical protein UFOVP815_43 [uncultured Caudovirales phage]
MVGSIIVYAFTTIATGTFAYAAASFAINLIASSIISKAFAPTVNNPTDAINPGNPQQVPPATDNKLPVVYGAGWVGGVITDLSITSNNQTMYYVLALSECTGTTDTITFGSVYFGGKKCIFDPTNQYVVTGLLDESTGLTDTTVNGYLNIYLYPKGSFSVGNSSTNAISVMQNANLVYQWNSTKLMTNCAFAIVQITYNQNANLTGIQKTTFQLTNSRSAPGDCFLDYLTSTTYGAALPLASIDTASLTELNAYCNGSMTYTTYSGATSTQTRFRFDGVLDTNQVIMNNLQLMASCCDCLLRYNELTGLWGVIVQKPTYTISMNLDDNNIISSIQVSPTDIASTYNIAEVKFSDGTLQDAFLTSTYNLAVINPSLMYPNEPINKQTISLGLVNNSVRAQYLANRFLESAREDLQIKCKVNYIGLQMEAGDIVTMTNVNYGWAAKLFRVGQVVENFEDDGSITTSLSLMEFNPAVYDDINITQFTPAPNTGIGNPLNFGTILAPSTAGSSPNAATPSFSISVTSSSAGIVQYAELWYSAYSNPSSSQLIFAGTTAVNSNGNPYGTYADMGLVTLANIAQGDWYFFAKMVNSIGKSNFSGPSNLLQWRPTTFQYVNRYLNVRYGSSITGTGFSTSPRGLTYYGLQNSTSSSGSTSASDYTWYLSPVAFGTVEPLNYLLFANRSNRKFSFSAGNASKANTTGVFVPTDTTTYDPTVWQGLQDGVNFIDLDTRTGQLTVTGTTSVSSADGLLSVTNNTNGNMVVSLAKFLNFGAGVYSKTVSISSLTIDIYGRVVGFTSPDNFYYTETVFTATASQTTFSVTHVVGNVLVFKNGILLDLTEYSETTTTVVLVTACTAGDIIVVINARAVSVSAYYETNNLTIASSTTNTVTYTNAPWQIIEVGDLLCFTNTGTPTTYAVQSINTTTKVITFTTTIAGATVGLTIYRYRAAGAAYRPFSRYNATLTTAATYAPTTWAVNSGFEEVFVNGSQFNEIDYDITAGTFTGFPSAVTGNFTLIQWSQNNFGVPCSNIINTITYSASGASAYAFSSNPLSMEVYANGVLLAKGSGYDYTATSTNWILATAIPNNTTLLNQQTFARDGAA